MCGRFAFFCKGQFGYESLQLPEPPPFERYNIAPTQNILAIRTSSETGLPEWALLHWGLVPSWSKESKTKHLLINARAEGIEAKPSFRGPVRHHRCIVPAWVFRRKRPVALPRKRPPFCCENSHQSGENGQGARVSHGGVFLSFHRFCFLVKH